MLLGTAPQDNYQYKTAESVCLYYEPDKESPPGGIKSIELNELALSIAVQRKACMTGIFSSTGNNHITGYNQEVFCYITSFNNLKGQCGVLSLCYKSETHSALLNNTCSVK